MSESVPTSVTSFAHRRGRAGSTASFTYYPDDGEDEEVPTSEEEVILDDEEEEDDSRYEEDSVDLEAGELAPMRRVSSAHSRASVHDRLLRSDSTKTDASAVSRNGRMSQKIYIVNEDLTIVAAGFRTSSIGFAAYTAICVATFGLAYLLLRWLPRWQVRLVGSPTALRDCTWVVIEVSIYFRHQTLKLKELQNQWGEFVVQDVQSKKYGRSLSTIFGSTEKKYSGGYDDDDDPILDELKILDYRYIRFSFHPLKDKFVLCNSWTDPAWTDVKSIRVGIDGDEKEMRELVFGKNLIDIEQKSIPQLLVDEV